jgi:serine/threonine-protein kinase
VSTDTCPTCSAVLPDEARYCLRCGTERTAGASTDEAVEDPSGASERLRLALAGRYAVGRTLGHGGMSTVYEAEDLKHHRQVALKVMRPKVATALGPKRFLREIELAARLAHPHIVPVHDSGEADGFLYYVMPLLEGETLRARLARQGELPVADVVRIVRDVADALAYAHGHGVVHRDIKPDNVLVSGRHALVTDFGVAKAVREAASGQTLTTIGVSLGTPAYMAPEQAAADELLDHRADIYALGVMAYELLTGETPFTGKSPQVVMTRHITEEPRPISEHRDSVPEPLANLVMRALRKKPADRWQSADDMVRELDLIATPSGGTAPVAWGRRSVQNRRGRRVAGVAAVIVAGALAVFAARVALGGRGSPEPFTYRQLTFAGDVGWSVMSADGRYVAYTVASGDSVGTDLWVQEVGGETRQIALPENVNPHVVKWSYDGTRLLLRSTPELSTGDGTWWTVPLLGGTVRGLGVAGDAALSSDGSRAAMGLYDAMEIVVRDLASGDSTSFPIQGPHAAIVEIEWAPDDRHIAFLAFERPAWTLRNLDIETGEITELLADSAIAGLSWSPDSDAVYYYRSARGSAAGEIWSLSVDPGGGRAASPRLVLPGVVTGANFSLGWARNRLAYTRVQTRSNLELHRWDDARGAYVLERALTSGTADKGRPATSPDGTRVAYSDGDRVRRNVFVQSFADGEVRQLTFGDVRVGDPVWSRDGTALAYAVASPQGPKVAIVDAEGGAPRVFDRSNVGETWTVAWGPGPSIVYQLPGMRNFAVLDPVTGEERPLLSVDSISEFVLFSPRTAISPDGSKLIGLYNRGPQPGFWLISLTDSTRRYLWSASEGHPEYWDADSQSIWWHSFPSRFGEVRRRTFDGVDHELTPYTWPHEVCPVGSPSRDHGVLVCERNQSDSDVWLIENFDPDLR